ncbi:sulfatase-like hydrolase/transferase [Bacillus ndiopicus]|uniref:sulfatase-like hydrolase/transferase n=1 Tax=Bacillus ndiopicus TaxID=1347368 RepID=UPI0005A91766|nr:sulfatase-like hydrolase/transferase [Bacillus ndiopicus]
MKEVVIEEIVTLKRLYSEITDRISANQLKEAQTALQQLKDSERTEKYYELLSEIYLKKKEYMNAKRVLEIGIYDFLNSKVLYYQLFEVLWRLKQYEEAIVALARSARLTFDVEERDKTTEKMKDLIPKLFDLVGEKNARKIISKATLILGEGDERAFPMDKDAKSWINRYLTDSKGQKYYVNLYKGYTAEDINMDVRYFLKTEIVQGKNYRYTKLNLNEESILPISSSFNEEIEITNDQGLSNAIQEKHMQKNRINYTKLQKGTYKLKSKNEFFLGNPIPNSKKEKNKLCIVLYIDGLSQVFLDRYNLNNLMPNTAQFFKESYWNKNCYTTSDWTFPSVASIFTGLTTFKHKVYHPNVNIDINKRGDMYTEKFKDLGFYTTQINNNWRIVPSAGYMEGFDRTIFQNFRGGFAIAEVLGEVIEHLSSFPNNDHFLWVGIEDLHDIADGYNQDVYQQTNLTLEERLKNERAEISVNAEYSEDKIIKYKNQLQRIDIYLESLYHYLEKNHQNDDVYVTIIADHGQGYIENSENFLHDGRRKVPFIFKGPTVPNKISNELMSITDYFPNMLVALGDVKGTDSENDAVILKDFGGQGRASVITETFHPKAPYHIVITDDKFTFSLKTKKHVEDDGLINFDEVKIQLLHNENQEDITEVNVEKVKEYITFVTERVIHYQYIQ